MTNRLRFNIWENRRDPSQTMILHEWQIPYDESPTTNRNWEIFFSFDAFNPLVQPYPVGTQLFRARHKSNYPYELIDVYPILDTFHVEEPGTYFVAYTAPINNSTKLPFQNIYVYVENATKR
jgi:hypothetical protein